MSPCLDGKQLLNKPLGCRRTAGHPGAFRLLYIFLSLHYKLIPATQIKEEFVPKRKVQDMVDTPAENPVEQTPQATVTEHPVEVAGPEQQKRTLSDPFGIAGDYAAGVHLLESRCYRQFQIRFDDKPSQPVRDAVKAEGFRYNGQDKLWTKQIQQDTAMQTRIDAERLFQEITGMIRQEKGVIERTYRQPVPSSAPSGSSVSWAAQNPSPPLAAIFRGGPPFCEPPGKTASDGERDRQGEGNGSPLACLSTGSSGMAGTRRHPPAGSAARSVPHPPHCFSLTFVTPCAKQGGHEVEVTDDGR
jgi:hypothetical protein